ncbi:hypothetical protein AB0M46_23440 [Dactylosporangium sp. NPDC051485]|uniref:hypothetical protein n=1 Tax=Dactylosporangium sp. NPDC051485 TaxID=3154846 RepID=UPI003445CDF9
MAGIFFGFIAIFGRIPKSVNLAEGNLKVPEYEQVLDEAADDVRDDPVKAIAKVETLFRTDRKAQVDPAALAQARTVFNTAVFVAVKAVLAKPEDLVVHPEGSSEAPAVVKAAGGPNVVLDVEYLGADLRTREAASLIRRLRAAGATKALVVTNSILTAKASDALVLMAGPDLMLKVHSWENGPLDRLRLGPYLRQLGAATKP